MISKICGGGGTDPQTLVRKVHGRIIKHHGIEVIIASLTGCITACDIDIMRQLKAEIDMAERHKQECMDRMQEICEDEYAEALHNLQSIPGVGMRAATSLIAEIGTDIISLWIIVIIKTCDNHYYDKDNLEVGKAVSCRVAVNHVVQLTEEEKAEAKMETISRYQREELTKIQSRNARVK